MSEIEVIFTDSSSFENMNLSTNELEILCVNRFSSNLVHRHIRVIFLTPEKWNAGHAYVKTGNP